MEYAENKLSKSFLEKIFVRENEKIVPIDTDEIIYIKSDGNYVDLKLKGNNNHLIRGSLSDVEEKLDSTQFFRVHRSYIVNAECIEYIEPVKRGGDFNVRLSDGDEIRMSRRYKDILDFFSIEE